MTQGRGQDPYSPMLEGLRCATPPRYRPLSFAPPPIPLSPSQHLTPGHPADVSHAPTRPRPAPVLLRGGFSPAPPHRPRPGALRGVVSAAICGPRRARGPAPSRPLPAWDGPSCRRLVAATRGKGEAAAAGTQVQKDPVWTAEMLGVAAGMTNRYGRACALGPPLPERLRAGRAGGWASSFCLPEAARPAAGERPGHAPAQARGGRGLRGPAELSFAA